MTVSVLPWDNDDDVSCRLPDDSQTGALHPFRIMDGHVRDAAGMAGDHSGK